MAGELAVLECHRLLCLIEHGGELEIRRELAVDGVHRVCEFAPLGRIRRQRSREPADQSCGRGNDGSDDVGHDVIVPR